MADLISPGVSVKEKDLTTTVRSEPTSVGAIGILAQKGPVKKVVTISSEEQLVNVFGKPNGTNHQYWFSAANFLGYSDTLKVVRIEEAGMKNAVTSGTAILIKHNEHYSDGDGSTGPYNDGSASVGSVAARTAGAWGNSLRVEFCNDAAGYSETSKTTIVSPGAAAGATTITVASATGLHVGDIIYLQEADGQKYRITAINSATLTIARYPTTTAVGFKSAIATSANLDREWRWADQFSGAPGTSTYVSDRGGANDEMHIIVLDEDADITGVENEILEKWERVSKASDGLSDEGNANYYADVLYNSSNYVYWMDHPAGATNWGSAAAGITFTDPTNALEQMSLTGGVGGTTACTEANRQLSYDLFADADTEDVNLVIAGPASVDDGGATTHAIYITDLVNARKDCVGFISPDKSDTVNIAKSYTQTTNVKGFFDALGSSSYVVYDSGHKKQYDKYNDVFRWIPLNADIAGCCARTDATNDPWWSPAGVTRGQIRGAVSLSFNPTQVERDTLYRARINPIGSFPGEGTLLFGDKTGLSKNSAFSRINVRRLFLTIEEACKVAARSMLFEFNDEFTRTNFKSMVDPYLRDVQARRGMTDFLVVCDETNNTGQVIDNNEFRADIYVKPSRSINFITLTFIATRTGVDFAEVVGRA